MTKTNARTYGALLLVGISLMLATLACYSGQIPGVFELTPVYTPTPLPPLTDGKFDVLDYVLVPLEPGRPSFALTTYAEPLLPSAMNSRLSCQGNTTAKVLYAGQSDDGRNYYLINCAGSVGWAAEERLAGPLKLSREDLAIALAPAGALGIEMLDDNFRPMPPNPLMSCKPESIVTVVQVTAADPDGDGVNTPFYQIDCPSAAGPIKGWVTGDSLFGPIEINVGDRALAVGAGEDGDVFLMANEPAPVSEDNVVVNDCKPGDILEARESKAVDGAVYYKMVCGDVEGWVDESRFVGPLRYDPGTLAVVYMPPLLVFEDELAELLGEQGVEIGQEEDTGDTETVVDPSQRKVVEYTPPLYLADSPTAPISQGENANVVGKCESNTIARLIEYAATDKVYYRVQCDECVAYEEDDSGQRICTAYETREGWADQAYLEGPVPFMTGERVTFKASSKAIMADDDGTQYARLPANLTGAASIGQYTEFVGRCPLDEGLEIVGVVAEQARTSSKFSFYYKVSCMGQRTVTEPVEEGSPQTVTAYLDEMTEITGFVSARDLEAMAE